VEHRLAPARPTALQVDAARARLELDLEIHRAVFGAYPETLDALVDADLTPARTLQTAGVATFSRNARGNRYALRYQERDPS
jgi:hypothetical protein